MIISTYQHCYMTVHQNKEDKPSARIRDTGTSPGHPHFHVEQADFSLSGEVFSFVCNGFLIEQAAHLSAQISHPLGCLP